MTTNVRAHGLTQALAAALAFTIGLIGGLLLPAAQAAEALVPDPRLRAVTYRPDAVVTLPVKRGVVTLVVLDPDEVITEVAAGLGSDCSKQDAAWCIATQPLGHTLFIKPKRSASAPNNLTVVTDRRTHVFRLDVLADSDRKAPVYRLVVTAPPPKDPSSTPEATEGSSALAALSNLLQLPSAQAIVAERLKAKPAVANAKYSMAPGRASDDIAPTLVFDDGRFTYLQFPGNRELPTVFEVLGDGSETLVNTRIEDDLLVVDRVGRRWMLRAGSAVVGVWNDAFDLDGAPPIDATTVPGVRRALKVQAPVAPAPPPTDTTVRPPPGGTNARPEPAPATPTQEDHPHE